MYIRGLIPQNWQRQFRLIVVNIRKRVNLIVSIRTVADDKFCDIFLDFWEKKRVANSCELSASKQFIQHIKPYLVL